MANDFDVNVGVRIDGVDGIDAAKKAIQAAFDATKINLNVGVGTSANAQQGLAGISTAAAKVNQSSRTVVKNLKSISSAASSINVDAKNVTIINKMAAASNQAARGISNAARETEKLKSQAFLAGEAFGVTARRFGVFLAVSHGFNALGGAIAGSVREALNFQHEMVRLSQIGDTSAASIGDISKEVGRLATTLGASSKDLSQVAVTLRQAGLSAQDTKTALEALAKTSLAATFDDIHSTTEAVIAMRQQFGVAADDIAKRLGAINTVSAEFAVESNDIVTAIKKAGGAFRAAAGDMVSNEQAFNQFISLFTSVRNTTRESADEIATGLRTIFARVQSNTVANSLKQMGVNLRWTRQEAEMFGKDVTGQFVGAYEAVRRLSAATRDIPTTDPRYSAIVEQLGGFRQISRVIPLLQQFGDAQKAYTVAQAGANSLDVDSAKAQNSMIVRLGKLKEELQDVIRLVSENKGIRAMAEGFLDLATAALRFSKALEPLVPMIAVVAGAKLFSGIKDFGKGGISTIKDPRAIVGTVRRKNGGVIPGSGRGDKVPMTGDAGDFILNREASQNIGYDRLDSLRRRKFQTGGRLGSKIPILAEPGEYYFDKEDVQKIGLANLNYANKTGSLPSDPRHRLAMKIKAMGGMKAMRPGFAEGGKLSREEAKKRLRESLSTLGGLGNPDLVRGDRVSEAEILSRVQEMALHPDFADEGKKLAEFYDPKTKAFNKGSGVRAGNFSKIIQSLAQKAVSQGTTAGSILSPLAAAEDPNDLVQEIRGLHGDKNNPGLLEFAKGKYGGGVNQQIVEEMARATAEQAHSRLSPVKQKRVEESLAKRGVKSWRNRQADVRGRGGDDFDATVNAASRENSPLTNAIANEERGIRRERRRGLTEQNLGSRVLGKGDGRVRLTTRAWVDPNRSRTAVDGETSQKVDVNLEKLAKSFAKLGKAVEKPTKALTGPPGGVLPDNLKDLLKGVFGDIDFAKTARFKYDDQIKVGSGNGSFQPWMSKLGGIVKLKPGLHPQAEASVAAHEYGHAADYAAGRRLTGEDLSPFNPQGTKKLPNFLSLQPGNPLNEVAKMSMWGLWPKMANVPSYEDQAKRMGVDKSSVALPEAFASAMQSFFANKENIRLGTQGVGHEKLPEVQEIYAKIEKEVLPYLQNLFKTSPEHLRSAYAASNRKRASDQALQSTDGSPIPLSGPFAARRVFAASSAASETPSRPRAVGSAESPEALVVVWGEPVSPTPT